MKHEHYYTAKPTSKLRTHTFTTTLRGQEFTFTTSSGVFSPKKIDLGTRMLIEHARVQPGQKLLDLGCGYGAVGIAFAKIADVTMIDINERATKLARENVKQNSVDATVKTGNMYDPVKDERFDVILLNPPQTAGRKVCNEMITKAKEQLTPGGTLQVVARHQKGGKQFQQHMQTVFGNAETIKKQSGYRIYLSTLQ